MTKLSTPLTALLRVQTPIIAAPMAGASGGALAAQVTAAGGFGFMAPGLPIYESIPALKREIGIARSILSTPEGSVLPIGIGLLGWKLEDPSGASVELLTASLEARFQAIWLSFGNDLGRWVKVIREHDRDTGAKTLIFILVSSLEEADVAVKQWQADVLVAQGLEAGGHGNASAPPVMTLVSQILGTFPQGPPVLAAGGLAGGAHVAAFLTLGAAGAVIGTRYLLSPESHYNEAQKTALRNAKASSTVRTMAFDEARGTTGWPHGVDGRGLYNQTVKDFDSGVDIQEIKKSVDDATKKGNADRMVIWAGTGVGLMNEIKGAKEITEEIHRDILHRLETVSQLVLSA